MSNKGTKKVFISYSWTSQQRVIDLAERLIHNGINVVIDIYDLKEGQDKYAFMEQSVNDITVDRVLIVCDKAYTEKANNRSGGVGDETVIISPEIYKNVEQEKFIPVIFENDGNGIPYCPHYIKSRIYIDLSSENNYEQGYEKLLRNIYDKPLYKKPALGTIPEWLENETVDLSEIRDIIKQLKGYTGNNPQKADYLVRKAEDSFINAAIKYNEINDNSQIIKTIDQTKPYRDLFVDYCEVLIGSPLLISDILTEFFESIYNNTRINKIAGTWCETDSDFCNFLIMELFICTTAVLIHYKRFVELNSLLTHTYFLKESPFSEKLNPCSYYEFYHYFRSIEYEYKPINDKPNLLTLTGDTIVNRERKPILTKQSIANADLVLYQVGQVLKITSGHKTYWFPTTYIYLHNMFYQEMWTKLCSKEYCLKIAPLFGVKTIEELKTLISSTNFPTDFGYSNSFDNALGITHIIKAKEIGLLN